MASKSIYTTIDELLAQMGTATSVRAGIEQEIAQLTDELDACDAMLDAAADREEYDEITSARKEAELDLKFARNRLNRFDVSPRIDRETLEGLLSQLDAETDAAAMAYRKRAERPIADLVEAEGDFDAAIGRVRDAVCKLMAIEGRAVEREPERRDFYRYERNTLYQRGFCDGTTVHPGLRDALALAGTARQPDFTL